MRAPATERPLTSGPEGGPSSPFPLRLSGPVIKGFGRGSKELQIPTANIPIEGLKVGGCETIESGVYYGFAGLDLHNADTGSKGVVFPMVMSIGWNPFYKNTVRSVEVHIVHSFPEDFYGVRMNLVILGFIRPEYDYVSKEALIEDIKMDIKVGTNSLERDAYKVFQEDKYLRHFSIEE
ncbi:uncharacterized protein LAJ45_11443 [Morchella importuna]|uniref:Riboflavin kinase n=1 Tax=Morchella conica CCBAS932 TaxID=1392247 RepID=A0A3N4K8H1_9PEZI|nr:uncharacterized protein LAJ45_11443 [Morchella importuna]KAH8144546.1 hypothetical protein LAJ45_11443 [Morchella importuna]RPB06834.1 riboflavin kinase [Morchella conica CCBAS932]